MNEYTGAIVLRPSMGQWRKGIGKNGGVERSAEFLAKENRALYILPSTYCLYVNAGKSHVDYAEMLLKALLISADRKWFIPVPGENFGFSQSESGKVKFFIVPEWEYKKELQYPEGYKWIEFAGSEKKMLESILPHCYKTIIDGTRKFISDSAEDTSKLENILIDKRSAKEVSMYFKALKGAFLEQPVKLI